MDLPENEYSKKFDYLRLNRIAVSRYKYGAAKINFGQKLVNALGSAELCLKKYLETENTEYLVDAANYIMFEFMYPQVVNSHFKATDVKDSAGIVGMSIKEIEEFKDNSRLNYL
jgi:hypothetical protein